MIRLSFMKATIALLILNIFVLFQSSDITETDLIGKWRIEGVSVTHPGICLKTGFEKIKGVEIEFTEENLLIFTSKDGRKLIKQSEKLSWSLRGNELVLKSSKSKEFHTSKYTHNRDTFTFQITNLIELVLRKK